MFKIEKARIEKKNTMSMMINTESLESIRKFVSNLTKMVNVRAQATIKAFTEKLETLKLALTEISRTIGISGYQKKQKKEYITMKGMIHSNERHKNATLRNKEAVKIIIEIFNLCNFSFEQSKKYIPVPKIPITTPTKKTPFMVGAEYSNSVKVDTKSLQRITNEPKVSMNKMLSPRKPFVVNRILNSVQRLLDWFSWTVKSRSSLFFIELEFCCCLRLR